MDKQYKLWVKSGCPYCEQARHELLLKGLAHTVFVMDEQLDELKEVQNKFEHKTVPVVVLESNGEEKLIGGYTELKEHLDEGSGA